MGCCLSLVAMEEANIGMGCGLGVAYSRGL